MIHILTNISRTKGNQTMKFGQLIEYNRNIFLEKLYQKCVRENFLRPFSKKSKLSVLFRTYNFIIKSITRSLIIPKKPRKMTICLTGPRMRPCTQKCNLNSLSVWVGVFRNLVKSEINQVKHYLQSFIFYSCTKFQPKVL